MSSHVVGLPAFSAWAFFRHTAALRQAPVGTPTIPPVNLIRDCEATTF
jgi:hypothetical protein